MKKTLRQVVRGLAHHGFSPLIMAASARHLSQFSKDVKRYRDLRTLSKDPRLQNLALKAENIRPILTDLNDSAGTTTSQYFIMDLWMARRLLAQAKRPAEHLDIGSRLDGFVGQLLAAGQPVTVVDIRPLPQPPAGLTFRQDDATTLASVKSNSMVSVSCLHAAEHFGLGRYGDPVDPLACFKLMAALKRIVAPGGRLYFATPIGRERVEFNAHRVFAPATIQREFDGLSLVETAVIDDAGTLHEGADPLKFGRLDYGCGLWIFEKPAAAKSRVGKPRVLTGKKPAKKASRR